MQAELDECQRIYTEAREDIECMTINLWDALGMQVELDECQRIYTKSKEAIECMTINL